MFVRIKHIVKYIIRRFIFKNIEIDLSKFTLEKKTSEKKEKNDESYFCFCRYISEELKRKCNRYY